MATVKLTTWMREGIVDKMLKHRFNGEYERFARAFADLALDCYNERYDTATRRKMKVLPEGWLPKKSSIAVAFGTSATTYLSLDFDGTPINCGNIYRLRPANFKLKPLPMKEWLVPHRHMNACQLQLEKNHPLALRFFQLCKDGNEVVDTYEKASRLGMQACNSVTTLRRLVEIWPECEPFTKDYERYADGPNGQLPAPVLADLNSVFRLPVAQKALA